MKYPPFCDIIKLEVSDLSEKNAEFIINKIYQNLLKYKDGKMSIYLPMPSPISKIKNRYRYRIIIKCRVGNSIISRINEAIDSVKLPPNMRINIDINPNNMN